MIRKTIVSNQKNFSDLGGGNVKKKKSIFFGNWKGNYEIRSQSEWYRKYNKCFWNPEEAEKMRVKKRVWEWVGEGADHDPDNTVCWSLECDSVDVQELKAFQEDALHTAILRELKCYWGFLMGVAMLEIRG